MTARRPRVLLGATGAIGVVHLPTYVNALRSLRVELTVVMTPTAERFLPAATVAHLAEVATDTERGAGHVALARWADLLMILPCTANTLADLATGRAPNLLTATALAHRRPMLLVPAMNADMWDAPPVQRNVRTLGEDGHQVVAPVAAPTYEVASGAVVPGLAPPPVEEILRLVRQALRERSVASPRSGEAA
jgi:phosphopantothenoylcysteine decarboxylase/phosphopantothenate--cysteine ligase